MLTEEMRMLAGLQATKNVVNPLPILLEAEQQKIIDEQQRIKDEKKSVFTHFDSFKGKMARYQEMIHVVNEVFSDRNKSEFLGGLCESKYSSLQKFADVVITDDMTTTMTYLNTHYNTIKNDLDKITALTEVLDESKADTYFVAKPLITHDADHNTNIPVFKYKTLEEKVASDIPYGAEIVCISEKLTIIKHSGKRFYSAFSSDQIKSLTSKGFLI